MSNTNRPERIDPVDLISGNYEAIDMDDALRLNMQNRTRAVVAARQSKPVFRWAIGLAGAAAVAAVLLMCCQFLTVPPGNKGAGQDQAGIASTQQRAEGRERRAEGREPGREGPHPSPPHLGEGVVVSRPGTSHNGGRMAHAKTSSHVTTGAPQTAVKAAPKLGPPMVVVVSVQQPVKDGAGKVLSLGDRVASGDTIRTGKAGRVSLVTRKGSELNLDSNSEITLSAGNIATIARGRLYCSNRNKEIARIDTPAGHVKLLGTKVDTNVVRKDTVAVTVVEGKVQLSNRHGNALVGAGKRSMLVAFRPPQAGSAVDTYKEISWYHGRGEYQSDFGDVAYSVPRDNSLITEVWAVAADGSGRQRVRSIIGRAGSSSWVPGERWLSVDAGSIVWFTPDMATRRAHAGAGHPMMGNRMLLLDAATGQVVPLSLPDGHSPFYQSLAPDPSLRAFVGTYEPEPGNRQSGLWLYDSRNGDIRRLLEGNFKTAAAWAPDSRHIAISKGQYYTADHSLVVVDVASGDVRDLGVSGAGASFSPDGNRLAYSGEFDGGGSWMAGVPTTGSVFVLDLVNAGKPVRISSGKGGIMPRWSPDGARILYVEGDSVWVSELDGSGGKQVYEGPVYGQPSWAPDGRALYLTIVVKGGFQTLMVAADGSGVIRTIADTNSGNELPPNVQAQTDAATAAIKEAVFQFALGKIAAFDGDLVNRRKCFSTSADIFSRLVWDYPLAGLTTDDALAYADVAAKELGTSDNDVLRDACKNRMATARFALATAVAKRGEFPPDVAAFVEWTQNVGWQSSWLRSSDIEHVELLGRCPGTVNDRPTPCDYTPPAPGQEPKVGDVILRCPLHPDHAVTWDENSNAMINRPLMRNAQPGERCRVERTPYWFENVGDGALSIIHHAMGATYEIIGKAKLLPTGKLYTDETMKFGALDEGSIARAIDGAGTLDWGSLSPDEASKAQTELDFCRAVALFEAKQPIEDCKVLNSGNLYKAIEGEPARLLFRGPARGSCGAVGSPLRFMLVGPEDIQLYQLQPSGRFRVFGTVKVMQTGQTCKNGWMDKDGKVISAEN